MPFPLSGLKQILGMLYTDLMTVYRLQEVTNADGTTDNIKKAVPELVDVPCRVSFTRAYDRPDRVEVDVNPIKVLPTIHCHPDVVTKSGDYCIVSRRDDLGNVIKIHKGYLGDSRWYSNHQEIMLNVEEES